MPRHSKNNTASSVFTYHEAQSLDYGTKKQRLGRDSFREYNACFLCLQTARDPVACSHGHLACKECMYESILTQKQNIKREQQQLEQKLLALQEKKLQEEGQAKQALLDEFEKTQTSMLGNRKRSLAAIEPSTSSTSSPKKKEEPQSSAQSVASTDTSISGTKRKFNLNDDDLKEIADKAIEKASQRLAEEKAAKAKSSLGSFWLPSLTPDAKEQSKEEIKPINAQPMCHADSEPHSVSIKSLIEVKFQAEDKNKFQCPACLKALSNSTKISVMRSCGHVICNTCVDMFVKKSKRCYVCEGKVKSKDIVDMSPEGTGFTGGSRTAEAKKWDVAFQ